jgi:hypothetical protein
MKRCPNPDCPDIELYGVVGEYLDTIDTCPKCGTALERMVEPDTTDTSQTTDGVEGYEMAARISNAALVPVAKSLLESAGIRFLTRNEHAQDLFGGGRIGTNFNLIVGELEFWVERAAFAEAREVLRYLEEAQ